MKTVGRWDFSPPQPNGGNIPGQNGSRKRRGWILSGKDLRGIGGGPARGGKRRGPSFSSGCVGA